VAQLSAGQPVDISFPGLAGRTLSAQIGQIASTPTVKDGNVAYPVQIDLPSTPPNLKMGMTAQVSVGSASPGADQPLVAPRTAVRSVSGQSTVTKVDQSGQWQDVPVQLGRTSGGRVELLGGLQEGDKIVLFDPPFVAAQPQAAVQP